MDGGKSLVREKQYSWVIFVFLTTVVRIYDFQELLSIASIVYGFAGSVPVIIWFVLRQMEAKLSLISAICLYGYSLFIYIPASVWLMPRL